MRTIRAIVRASLISLLLAAGPSVGADAPIDLAAARATDPNTLGWMMGSPPPPDKCQTA